MVPIWGKGPPKPSHPLDVAYKAVFDHIRVFPPRDLWRLLEPVEKDTFRPTELIFTPLDPVVFFAHESGRIFSGQEEIKARLHMHLKTTPPTARIKLLFSGPAGTGKTTLAKIIARYRNEDRIAAHLPAGRFFFLLPSQIKDVPAMDTFMMSLRDGDFVFVDEAHDLLNLEALFPVLDDTGIPLYPLSNGQQLQIPKSVSWIFATTDPGLLDKHTGGAFRRRLVELRMDPHSTDTLVEIISSRTTPIDREAALRAAERSNQLPWQIIQIYEEAERVAQYNQQSRIEVLHMEKAFQQMKIDEHGLLQEDRDVIHALFQTPYMLRSGPMKGTIVYRMSKEAVCAAAGVDPHTYTKRIQPKLLKQGLLSTIGGQSLTAKAVELYGHLK